MSSLTTGLGSLFWKFRRRENLEACILLIYPVTDVLWLTAVLKIRVGSTVKQAEPLCKDQEQKLWNLGLLGEDSPSVLLHTMVFLIGKNFSLRSGRELCNLKFSQLTLVPGTDRDLEKLICVFWRKE